MLSYEQIRERSIKHYKAKHIEEKELFLKDPACSTCYPPGRVTEEFNRFWNWYQEIIYAVSYSAYTVKIFEEILKEDKRQTERIRDKIVYLVGSVKYSREPILTVQESAIRIAEILICSNNFTLSIEQAEENLKGFQQELESNKKETEQDSEEIQKGSGENSSEEKGDSTPEQEKGNGSELIEIPDIDEEVERFLESLKDINTSLENLNSNSDFETSKSEELEDLINTEDLELKSETNISETESESSEYNLDLLFEEDLVNMAVTDAQFQARMEAIFGAHGENLRPIRKVNEFWGRDDEDPHEWCAEFEKVCAANGWAGNDNNVRRKNIAGSYLRGNAAEWYETDQGNIVQWHIDGNNDNFRERFKDYFSPQSKQIQWQLELTSIKQGLGESIEDYAKRFKKIMRKVNYVNALAEGVKVNYFIKGLNPLYITQVMMTVPADLNTAVARAKLLETGTQIAGLSVIRNTNQTEQDEEKVGNDRVKRSTFMREKDVKKDELDDYINNELSNRFDKIVEIKLANMEQGGRNNRNKSGNVRENEKRCYNCNRSGHIARECNNRERNNYQRNDRRCSDCGRLGHTTKECFRNQTCQKCGKVGHTRDVCRSTISRLNYVEDWNNDEEFYSDEEFYDNEEAYVTTRSGFNTQRNVKNRQHIPEAARRLQQDPRHGGDHQRREDIVIQQSQQSQYRPRKRMDIDDENIKVKRTRDPSRIDKEAEYDIVEDLLKTLAHPTFAQMLKEQKHAKNLRNAMSRKGHVEIADEQ